MSLYSQYSRFTETAQVVRIAIFASAVPRITLQVPVQVLPLVGITFFSIATL